jgi:hypothetical protein
MPLPQVSDRIKELPGQALRAVFAGVGQLLLAADKVRAQLAAPSDEPAQPAAPSPEPAAPPAASPPAAAAPARATPAGSSVAPPEVTDPAESRWRSLDKTGNVRLLHDGDPDLSTAASTPPAAAEPVAAETAAAETAEPEPADLAVPTAAEPAVPTPAQPAVPVSAEPAVPVSAEPAVPTPDEPAVPTPAEVATPAPAEPVLAEPTMAVVPEPTEVTATAEPAAATGADLPVAGYDQLSVASLRARLRVLDVTQVRTLLDYEKAHQNRADMVTMFERRIAKLEQGG